MRLPFLSLLSARVFLAAMEQHGNKLVLSEGGLPREQGPLQEYSNFFLCTTSITFQKAFSTIAASQGKSGRFFRERRAESLEQGRYGFVLGYYSIKSRGRKLIIVTRKGMPRQREGERETTLITTARCGFLCLLQSLP